MLIYTTPEQHITAITLDSRPCCAVWIQLHIDGIETDNIPVTICEDGTYGQEDGAYGLWDVAYNMFGSEPCGEICEDVVSQVVASFHKGVMFGHIDAIGKKIYFQRAFLDNNGMPV